MLVLCSLPSAGTAAWPPVDSDLRPSASAVTPPGSTQRAAAGGAPTPLSFRSGTAELRPACSGWTGRTPAAGAELRDRWIDCRKVKKWGNLSCGTFWSLFNFTFGITVLIRDCGQKKKWNLRRPWEAWIIFIHVLSTITSAWAGLSVVIDPP